MTRPAAQRRSTFGPSALATPANALTLLRLVLAPVMVVLVSLRGASWWLVVLWILLTSSDGLDGWVARKQGTTRSGAFLDPLADKAVVLGVLAVVVVKHDVSWIPAALIAVREIGMSVYRSLAGRRGVSIPARPLAKVKTIVQDAAIGLCILPPTTAHHGVLAVAIWVAAALTLASGAQYWLDGRRAFRLTAPAAGGAPHPHPPAVARRAPGTGAPEAGTTGAATTGDGTTGDGTTGDGATGSALTGAESPELPMDAP